MKKRSLKPAIITLIVMFVLVAAYAVYAIVTGNVGGNSTGSGSSEYKQYKTAEDRICKGVYIGNVDLSGKNKEEAQAVVDAYVEGLSQRDLIIEINGVSFNKSLSELGFTYAANDYIDQAIAIGTEGNADENISTLKKVATEHVVYPLDFSCDEKLVKKYLKKLSKKDETGIQKPKDAKIKMSGGSLVYTESEEGMEIDNEITGQAINDALDEQLTEEGVTVAATLKVKKPEITTKMAARCKDKLGDFSTIYTASNVNRSKNVALAASRINGTVLKPGETFSVNETIQPRDAAHGYEMAGSYVNGEVVDSEGGGVCQVSTTLYNAILESELEIVERSPHSMVVSYVSHSKDAAIAGDYKDFKFKNNTDAPIYIEGGAYGGTLYFNVYGEETRSSDRTISFESVDLETIQPGKDKVTYDKSQPKGYEDVTQEAHIGYKSQLWKIVSENGKTERILVNTSTYQASPRYVTKGSGKKPKATPKPTKKPQATKKPSDDKPKATEAPEPEVTPEPVVTATPEPVATATPEPAADATAQ